MYPASESLRTALLGSHEMTVQIDVFTRRGLRAQNIPFSGGIINASLLSDVCRSGSFTVTRHLTDQGLLDPAQDRVRITTGIPGFPLIPIFIGRVMDQVEADDGQVQIMVEDYGRDIVDARFESPWSAISGSEVHAEMRRIIKNVDENFSLNSTRALLSGGSVPPALVWEENRAGALDELASGINCIWQSDRIGGFELYPNPYNLTTPPPLTLTLTEGNAGNLTSYAINTTRDGVYNSVTVLVERAENTNPHRVTVRDTASGSPFRWGGEFGKVNRIVRLQTPGGYAEAARLAQRLLNQSLSLFRSWRLSTPHFPLLDPGDVIGATVSGTTTAQVVETISYPLAAIEQASIATRELRQVTEVN